MATKKTGTGKKAQPKKAMSRGSMKSAKGGLASSKLTFQQK